MLLRRQAEGQELAEKRDSSQRILGSSWEDGDLQAREERKREEEEVEKEAK